MIDRGRRRFLGSAAVAGAGALAGSYAQAEEAKDSRVNEDDPQAVALSYVHDASKVDATRHARFAPGQTCANCSLMRDRSSEWGPCLILGGRMVNAAGWCSVWSAAPDA